MLHSEEAVDSEEEVEEEVDSTWQYENGWEETGAPGHLEAPRQCPNL